MHAVDTMVTRFCHPSDFSQFFKVKSDHSNEFEGVFGDLFNSIIPPFLRKLNSTVVINFGHGLGEATDHSGSYDGCLGLLQRNQSDVLLRLADYPTDCDHIIQGDIFLDTRLMFSQLYHQNKKDRKFQILSAIKSLNDVLPYILFYFICAVVVLKCARVIIKMNKSPQVYFTFGSQIQMNKVTNQTTLNVFAHAFRFGALRAKRVHSRMIFLSLSIFSLVVINIFYSSIKTDLVVVTEPDHWESYEQLMRDRVTPIFIKEMETARYFKSAEAGSPEYKLWQYTVRNFDPKATLIPADVSSFFKVGRQVRQRNAVLILDQIMARVVRNAACSLNKYNYANFATALNGVPLDSIGSIYFYITADTNSKTIQKGVVYSEFFASKIAVLLKKFIKDNHERGIMKRSVDIVSTKNIIESTVRALPPSEEDPSIVSECKSDSIFKSGGQKEKLVTLGNTVSLRVWYGILNAVAFLLLTAETLIAAKKSRGRQIKGRRRKMRPIVN